MAGGGTSLWQKLNARYGSLLDTQSSWRREWRQIQKFLMPEHGLFLQGESTTEQTENTKDRMFYILDSEGVEAIEVLAAGLMSGLTSPSRPWFRLTTDDEQANEKAPVRIWLSDVEKRMRTTFSQSNFYRGLHHSYKELGGFCTAAMALLEDDEKVIKTRTFTAGEYALAVDFDGNVNTFYRRLSYSANQLIKRFGRDRVSEDVIRVKEQNDLKTQFFVVQVIEPKSQVADLNIPNEPDLPWISLYYEESSKNITKFLSVGGFEENPLLTPRWFVVGNAPYGRGPGFRLLPEVKMLQKQVEKKLNAVDKLIDPPLQADGSMKQTAINTLPNGINFIDGLSPTAGRGVQPLYQISPDMSAIFADIQNTQQKIRRGFFNDLFQQLALLPRKNMTATEVVERHEEKLLQLGPVLERLHAELLSPAIDRTFAIMLRKGLLPPPPAELEGQLLNIEYISVLAQAQRVVGIGAIEQFTGFVGQLAEVIPSALDKVDFDEIVEDYAEAVGVRPSVLIDDALVQQIRTTRAQQAQQQQSLEIAQQAADVVKTAGEVDPNSAVLQQLNPGNQVNAPQNPIP